MGRQGASPPTIEKCLLGFGFHTATETDGPEDPGRLCGLLLAKVRLGGCSVLRVYTPRTQRNLRAGLWNAGTVPPTGSAAPFI